MEDVTKEEEIETTEMNDSIAQTEVTVKVRICVFRDSRVTQIASLQLRGMLQEEDDDSRPATEQTAPHVGDIDNAMSFNQQVYRIGDFVYAEPKERGMEYIIFEIQRLWVNQENQQMMYGNQYYRPSETYHVTTRRFLENVSRTRRRDRGED